MSFRDDPAQEALDRRVADAREAVKRAEKRIREGFVKGDIALKEAGHAEREAAERELEDAQDAARNPDRPTRREAYRRGAAEIVYGPAQRRG